MIDTIAEDGKLTLRINRPDKANSLTEGMLNELADLVLASTAQVLILTGEGTVFSAGADLGDVKTKGLATSPAWERLSSAVANFKGLSVAALNGPCAGGALGMVLACDLRIAVPSATFFYPVIKIGVLPQPSDPARMVALIGPSATKLMLLTGARLDVQQALALGLIDQISDTLMADVWIMIEPALRAPPEQLARIKAMIG